MLSETNSVMEGQIGFHFREVPRVEKIIERRRLAARAGGGENAELVFNEYRSFSCAR